MQFIIRNWNWNLCRHQKKLFYDNLEIFSWQIWNYVDEFQAEYPVVVYDECPILVFELHF